MTDDQSSASHRLAGIIEQLVPTLDGDWSVAHLEARASDEGLVSEVLLDLVGGGQDAFQGVSGRVNFELAMLRNEMRDEGDVWFQLNADIDRQGGFTIRLGREPVALFKASAKD